MTTVTENFSFNEQVNRNFDRAAALTSHDAGVLSQIRACNAVYRLSFPLRRDDGRVQVIDTEGLVPGDVVLLEAGNLVPADLRLHEVAQLRVDESALTGESVTVAKQTDTLAAQDTSALGDRVNMAFKGTTASKGLRRP